MQDRRGVTRRRIVRAGVGSVLGAGALATTATAQEGDEGDDTVPAEGAEQIPLLDVVDELETVLPSTLAEEATGIRPGSQLFIDGSACSANFVWEDDSDNLYLGAAGHCFLSQSLDAPDAGWDYEEGEPGNSGSLADSVKVSPDPTFGGLLGQNVVQGQAVELGDVVYARQASEDGTGIGHDFGLVEIPRRYWDEDHDEFEENIVDPSIPQFGGPVQSDDEGPVPAGNPVVQYGAGVANGELFLTQGRRGLSLGGDENSWSAAFRATPGDSGSALLAAEVGLGSISGGRAAGVLTHVSTNGIGGTTIQQCKDVVEEDIGLGIDVVVP